MRTSNDSQTLSASSGRRPRTLCLLASVVALFGASLAAGAKGYTTVSDGRWSSGSTWEGGRAPGLRLGSHAVTVAHRVTIPDDNLEVQDGKLVVQGVLIIDNNNLELERGRGRVDIDGGLIILGNGNLMNKAGTVDFIHGAVQLCNGNYTDESSGGSRGTLGVGYIYSRNGNIENKGSAPFSSEIAWASPGGSGVGLPTRENRSVATPPGCRDEAYHRRLRPPSGPSSTFPNLYYTYDFTNDAEEEVEVAFFDSLPEGMLWDTSYTPMASGGLSVRVVYSNGGRDAKVAKLMLPPGKSSLTLRTQEAGREGTVSNEASITPKDPARGVEVVASAEIVVEATE